jgi:hypothetical protein
MTVRNSTILTQNIKKSIGTLAGEGGACGPPFSSTLGELAPISFIFAPRPDGALHKIG